jgi:cytochrome P450
MMAGTLTTAWALDVIMFWLLSQPETLFKLKQELRQAIPDPNDIGILPLPTLEQLPYLSAVILEGLRLSYGVSCRLARISYEDITYIRGNESYLIPAGTPMGMTSTQIHHDERLFPNSKTFLPERWLDGDNVNKELEKYLLSFSGGSRQCVGINLAYAEMYSCLSAVWRVWGSSECRGPDDEGIFELYETGKRDVEIEIDHFLPIQQEGSKGIRVVARC